MGACLESKPLKLASLVARWALRPLRYTIGLTRARLSGAVVGNVPRWPNLGLLPYLRLCNFSCHFGAADRYSRPVQTGFKSGRWVPVGRALNYNGWQRLAEVKPPRLFLRPHPAFGEDLSMMRVFTTALVLIGLGVTGGMAEDKVDFTKQVLPILKESCGKCHGETKGAAKLRMHTAEALKVKWDTDPGLIMAGKPEESELYKRITLPAADKKRMPKGGDPLAKDKIDLIGRWI